MRPTPAEELAAMARTLDEAVAPALRDEYAATQLRQVVDRLRRLGGDWDAAAGSLDAECDALERFLRSLADVVPADLPLSPTYPREDGFTASAARHVALRTIFDDALRSLDSADDSPRVREARAAAMAFLRESADHWRL